MCCRRVCVLRCIVVVVILIVVVVGGRGPLAVCCGERGCWYCFCVEQIDREGVLLIYINAVDSLDRW